MRSWKLMMFLFLVVCLTPLSCGDGDEGTTDGDQENEIDGDDEAEATDGDDEATDGDMDEAEQDLEADGDDDVSGENDTEIVKQYPDHTFIYERRTPPKSLPDSSYNQEFSERFVAPEALADADVYSMTNIAGTIVVGTSTGIYKKSPADATFVKTSLTLTNPIIDLSRTLFNTNELIFASESMIGHLDTTDWTGLGYQMQISAPIKAVASTNDKIYWADATGMHISGMEKSAEQKTNKDPVLDVSDIEIAPDGKLLLATANGVLEMASDIETFSTKWSTQNGTLLDDDVRDIAVCEGHPNNRVVVASATGLAIFDGATMAVLKAEKGGLPTDQILSVDCNDKGIVVGYEIGASWIDDDLSHKDYYISARWMPEITNWETDNQVRAVAANDTERWVGTNKGVSKIYLVERTLADKEAYFDSEVVDHFWRMDGFFASDGRFPDSAWQGFDEMTRGDKDNDGLWTQMMIGGWCFAYVATGEEKYRDYARKGMQNMFKLFEFPAITFEENGLETGFISRSIVREDEGTVYSSKADAGFICGEENNDGCVEYKDILRWNPINVDGTNYYWKADTSSDEYAGHYFGFPVYYDLCANDEEKAKIAEYTGKATQYIVDGGYRLLDLDGSQTTHGHWQPAHISACLDGLGNCTDVLGYTLEECMDACTSGIGGGGWLNAIEILGQLLATYHMTGDTKFYDTYEYLLYEERYMEVAMPNDLTMTIISPSIANHSDHELAMLAYTTLIRYEPDDERRAYWIESLEFLYAHEKEERNPWWAAVCALSGCEEPDVDSSLQTLREIPDDIREWYINNTHRKDMVEIVADRHGDRQCDTTFPYDEIRTMWWNGNPYDLESGGDGRGLSAPTTFLLPYYMNLYSGLISSEK